MSTSHYHHGDLRRALVTAALHQLEKGGAESVGLRETARAVGVSPSAPYRHFDSRARLLTAVAAEGFRRFFAVLRDARDTAPRENGLAAMGQAYVRFALENPALFRLMFSPELEKNRDPLLAEAASPALMLLAEVVEPVPRTQPGSIGVATIGSWALVHGLAHLLLDKQVPGVTLENCAPLVAAVTAAWTAGMAHHL